MSFQLAGQRPMEPPPDIISELMSEMEVTETVADADFDWLSSLDGSATLPSSSSMAEVRRSNSSPALHLVPQMDSHKNVESQGKGWMNMRANSVSGPLPIGDVQRFPHRVDEFSSMESSQSLLTGSGTYASTSYTDESALIHQQSNIQRTYPLGGHFGSAPVPTKDQPISIPGIGGRWQWIPDSSEGISSGSKETTNVLKSKNDCLNGAPGVNIASGPLPLPLAEMDLEGDPLDDIDILEMVETLMPTESKAKSIPNNAIRLGGFGSCPLPTLLEDSVSCGNENSGGSSDDTLHGIAGTASPSVEATDSPFNLNLQRSFSANIPSGKSINGGRPSIHFHGNTGSRTVPIPAKAPQLKRSGSSGSRSLSSPHLASELLASSLPGSVSSDRPIRSAARRSLALATAALQSGSDSESEDVPFGERRVTSNATAGASIRRVNSSGRMYSGSHTSNSNKKKHNPWSLEETLALVEGVQMAGPGKWAEIKRLPVPAVSGVLENRSPVDLKDKWRNLCRVARLPKAALKQRLSRAHSDVPLETMLQVKQLMEANGDGE